MDTRFASKIDGWLIRIMVLSVGGLVVEITPSRNPLSSPALSIDRLKIQFGKRKFVLVSPEDKAGFIRAVDQTQQESNG